MTRSHLVFGIKAALVYAIAYLVAGGLAYQLLTKPLYVGEGAVFAAFMRSEANPVEWSHVNVWLVPGLLLRSALIAAVLVPFAETLRRWPFASRVAAVFALTFVLLHLAAAAPSPSNIEGLVYLRPQLVGVGPFLLTQPEMILQCLLFALGASWALKKRAVLHAPGPSVD